MPLLSYFYVFLWAALAVLCILIGRKIGITGWLLAVFFAFMAIWYGLGAFAGLPVFNGVLGYVFRGVLLAFLVVIVVIWFRSRRAQLREKNKTIPHAEDCHCEHCEEEANS